jgi:hypothetical protein
MVLIHDSQGFAVLMDNWIINLDQRFYELPSPDEIVNRFNWALGPSQNSFEMPHDICEIVKIELLLKVKEFTILR